MKKVGSLAVNGGTPAVPTGAMRRWPEITQDDKDAVMAVLERGELWGAFGTEVMALQEEWADFVGTKYCLAVNSGTAALHCALAAVGVEPGDEVIVPAWTFTATAMAVLHLGATPVFCDVDPRTFNIDPTQVESLIGRRTRAILPVHLHGMSADMGALMEIAQRHGLAVVEDACQAHGATYRGQAVGSLGQAGAFSLNGCKNLSAGEGGLFVTDDEVAFRVAHRLAIFGEDTPALEPNESRSYWSHGVGWNYRTQEMSAALARSQLARLSAYMRTAQENGAALSEGLSALPGVEPPYVPEDCTHTYNRYRVTFDAEAMGFDGEPIELRDRLLQALRAEGVPAALWELFALPAGPVFRRDHYAPWTPALDREDLRDWASDSYPVTTRIIRSSLSLTSPYYNLAVQEAAVIGQLVDAFEKIWSHLDELFSFEYTPARIVPAIPAEILAGPYSTHTA